MLAIRPIDPSKTSFFSFMPPSRPPSEGISRDYLDAKAIAFATGPYWLKLLVSNATAGSLIGQYSAYYVSVVTLQVPMGVGSANWSWTLPLLSAFLPKDSFSRQRKNAQWSSLLRMGDIILKISFKSSQSQRRSLQSSQASLWYYPQARMPLAIESTISESPGGRLHHHSFSSP